MKPSTLIPYIAAVLMSIPKTHVVTASVTNLMRGKGAEISQRTIFYMEDWSRSTFLHSDTPDIYITIQFGNLPDQILGLAETLPGRCLITISNDLNPDLTAQSTYYMDQTLIHEIGHCFGLKHNDDKRSVMFWAESPNHRFNHEDMVQFFDDLNKIRGVK